jgi:hypothetical protein
MYGGNSNWRGPIWVPLNLLAITGLRRLGMATANGFTIEFPTRSGRLRTPTQLAGDLGRRLSSLYRPGRDGTLPAAGHRQWPANLMQFHEYFDGDTGAGLGAAHQTGWTAGLINLLTTPTDNPPE